jgi:hypothetical protein
MNTETAATETTTVDKPADQPIATQAAPPAAQQLATMDDSPAARHYALRRRQAADFSKSDLVPEQYRGKPANVIIAMEIADRIGASYLAVMQNLYIVQGKPSFSAQFLIGTVNSSGRFTPMRFEILGGEDPFADSYRVRAVSTDLKSGDELKGTWIDWKLVRGEKWDQKTGSKWKTMPAQMFLYRAATYWTRVFAPEVSLGMQTTEELRDIGIIDLPDSAIKRGDPQALAAKLLGQDGPAVTDAEMDGPAIPHDADGVVLTRADFEAKFKAAKTADECHELFDLTRGMSSQEDRTYLLDVYEKRLEELEA